MKKNLKPGRLLKTRMAEEYSHILKGISSIFVTDCGRLTNKELQELRKKLKSVSASYKVVKNSICKITLEGLKVPNAANLISGTCALGYGSGDPVSISKVLVNFGKDNKNFKLSGGYVDGGFLTLEDVKGLAELPTKEVLIARLVGCLNSPISGLVSVCSNVIKQFLYVVNDIIKKRETK
jgi:large subunit ribosomal protein L10